MTLAAQEVLDVPAVVQALRVECYEAGSAKAWGLRHDFSGAFVSRVLSGQQTPSRRMIAALGFKRAGVVVGSRCVYGYARAHS